MSMLQKINNQIHFFNHNDLLLKKWGEEFLSNEAKEIYWRCMPVSADIFFELNASFVWNYKSLESMSRYNFITLRDGYYGLFYFFLKNPIPLDKLETVFLVPKKFSYLVPKLWKNNILLYSFDFLQKEKMDKTVVFGTVTSDLFMLESVEEKVKNLELGNSEIVLATIMKERSFFNNKHETDLNYKFISEVHKKYGFDLDFIVAIDDDGKTEVDQNFSFINIDSDNFMITYDYPSQLFASRGASCLSNEPSIVDESQVISKIALSPYHNIVIEEPSGLTNDILKSVVEIKTSGIPLKFSSSTFYEYAKSEFVEKNQGFLKNK